jgi:hypothetical protein
MNSRLKAVCAPPQDPPAQVQTPPILASAQADVVGRPALQARFQPLAVVSRAS